MLKRRGNNIGEKKLEREQLAPRGEFLPRQFQTALLVLAWTTLLKLSTCTSCQFGHNLACESSLRAGSSLATLISHAQVG